MSRRQIVLGVLFFVFIVVLQGRAEASYFKAEYFDDGNGNKTLLYLKAVDSDKTYPRLDVSVRPETIVEYGPMGSNTVVTLCCDSEDKIRDELLKQNVDLGKAVRSCKAMSYATEGGDSWPEIIPLIVSGPAKNRIDFTFLGDGYTLGQRELFISDITRLVDEMYHGSAFASYLPIFNVYAVFRPSVESGIGKNGIPKNTAYHLAREGNTLRAIYVADMESKWAGYYDAISAPDCDYLIMIANDPYYAGTVDYFIISTSSKANGTVCLKHEMAHSIGEVGDEYDGNPTVHYYGANFSESLSKIKWRKWLSGPLREEPAKAVFIDWPWRNWSTGLYPLNFVLDSDYEICEVDLSFSGVATDDTLSVLVDGKEYPIHNSFGDDDRYFYRLRLNDLFAGNKHYLRIIENIADGNNMLGSVQINEYGQDYHFEDGYVGAYPMFNDKLEQIGYRPVHSCIMRDMDIDKFCPACEENLWRKMFKIITLIDDLKVQIGDDKTIVRITVPKLGQFREGAKIPGERLDIKWFKQDAPSGEYIHAPEFDGKRRIELNSAEAAGQWKVKVRLITPEVRFDPKNDLLTVKTFQVGGSN